jgi:hypothetical protein
MILMSVADVLKTQYKEPILPGTYGLFFFS